VAIAAAILFFPPCPRAEIHESGHSAAQLELPRAKSDQRVFFVGVSLLAAAKTADALTTRHVLDLGGSENDPIFGRHPSVGRQIGTNAAVFAAQYALFYLTERNRHAWVRWTGRLWLGATITAHTRLAICNAGLTRASLSTCGNWGLR